MTFDENVADREPPQFGGFFIWQLKPDLGTVSTTRGSGWVRERCRTHPLPRVVLTPSKLD